ncbi:MAG: class I SAM-dependent methyltransferase [Candidatus Woesearchaeota archaeon]
MANYLNKKQGIALMLDHKGVLTDKEKQHNNTTYREFLEQGLPNGWDPVLQYKNFMGLTGIEMHAEKPLKGAKVLDAGCGTGEFSEILRSKGVSEYVGMDILSDAIETARKNYPSENFIN